MTSDSKSRSRHSQSNEAKPSGALPLIPPDLMEVDLGPETDEGTGKAPAKREFHPGFVEPTPARPFPCVLLVLCVIAILIGVALWLIGQGNRYDLADLFDWLHLGTTPAVVMVDSRNGVVLMLEQSGSARRVVVEMSDEASWLLVSRDDTTAENPALSADGGQVAYVTEREDGQVVIVSLRSDTRRTIDADQVETAGKDAGFDGMAVCPWTPLAWAPDGNRIAFFGCTENESLSAAVVVDLTASTVDLAVLGSSRVDSSDERQLRWLDRTRLVVTSPAAGQQPATIITYDVH